MATFEIGTGYKKTSWCSAEIICNGDCPHFTDTGSGVTVYHLYNVSGCDYISKSSLVIDIRYKGADTWLPWITYTMGDYEGFVYYQVDINDGIGWEFKATYKGITKYYSIVAPCVPDWQCEIPLNGYEEDGCGNRKENIDCVDQCVDVTCPDICVDTDLWYQKCEPETGNCVLDKIHFNNHESCGGGPIRVCIEGCGIEDIYNYYTGNLVDDECEFIENSELCGYIPPQEDTINNYIILGGLGLLGYTMLKMNKNKGQ